MTKTDTARLICPKRYEEIKFEFKFTSLKGSHWQSRDGAPLPLAKC